MKRLVFHAGSSGGVAFTVTLGWLLSWPLAVPAPAEAAPTARAMYVGALARERSVRVALDNDASPHQAVVEELHAVVAAYETIVRRYPASGYSDNALWQGGRLLLDAFDRFGRPADWTKGARLLRSLATRYPSSKLARRVPGILEAAGAPTAPTPARDAAVSSAMVDSSSATNAAPSSTRSRPSAPFVSESAVPAAGSRSTSPSIAIRPAAAAHRAIMRDVRRDVLPDVVRVTIDLDAETPFHEERLSDPPRVFVDLSSTRAAPGLADQTLRFDRDRDIVRLVRIGRHPNNTTRVVLDAAGVSSYSIYAVYSPYRLVIDCARTQEIAAADPAPAEPGAPWNGARALRARQLDIGWARLVPRRDPRRAALPQAASTPATPLATRPATLSLQAAGSHPAPAVTSAATPPAVPSATQESDDAGTTETSTGPPPGSARTGLGPGVAATPGGAGTGLAPGAVATGGRARSPVPAPLQPPDRNLAGGFSMARQLGLHVSRIVVDPGHGGHDPGAKGPGVSEAELVLDVALRLEALLHKLPGVEVVLTRRTDEFVPLQERTAIANREAADLFLSIHANANARPQARGVETYFLNFAQNLSEAAVAARENAASGQAMGALPDFVKTIALNNKLEESRDFATAVQRALIARLRGANRTPKDLGVKPAPFVVLIGAAMPSVLAEISFVTNPQEARLLRGTSYRQRIAEALFTAIRTYQTSLKGVTAVASQ